MTVRPRKKGIAGASSDEAHRKVMAPAKLLCGSDPIHGSLETDVHETHLRVIVFIKRQPLIAVESRFHHPRVQVGNPLADLT